MYTLTNEVQGASVANTAQAVQAEVQAAEARLLDKGPFHGRLP